MERQRCFDNDVPEDTVFSQGAKVHQVVHPRDALPTTTKDDEVFRYANANDYIMVTCNRDDFLSLIGDVPFTSPFDVAGAARQP